MPFFGKGYDGLADCYHPKGLECQKVIQYSVFSFFRDSYLFHGYKL